MAVERAKSQNKKIDIVVIDDDVALESNLNNIITGLIFYLFKKFCIIYFYLKKNFFNTFENI